MDLCNSCKPKRTACQVPSRVGVGSLIAFILALPIFSWTGTCCTKLISLQRTQSLASLPTAACQFQEPQHRMFSTPSLICCGTSEAGRHCTSPRITRPSSNSNTHQPRAATLTSGRPPESSCANSLYELKPTKLLYHPA